MAKRKRLTPAQSSYLDTENPVLETKSIGLPGSTNRPPIAQVAGEASATSALQELASEVKQAKEDGRMILDLPLDQVDVGYLVRDRMMAEEDELQVLMDSLRKRGQQTPIEVVELEAGRYGLISGWRRLTALGRLAGEPGGQAFATVKALLRRPDTAEEAYVAMVEENEIRVGLSYYERARVAAKAVEQGVYEHEREALQHLFHAASRAKRSKIGSFLKLYHALDKHLHFAPAIPERLGMALVKAMDGNDEVEKTARLALSAAPAKSPEAEIDLLERILMSVGGDMSLGRTLETEPEPVPTYDMTPAKPIKPRAAKGTPLAVEVAFDGRQVVLTGTDVDEAFLARLKDWLRRQG